MFDYILLKYDILEKKINSKMPNCPNCKKNNTFLKFTLGKFRLFICNDCLNGFIHPKPTSLDNYYPQLYWQFQGKFSSFRKWLHFSLQRKRTTYLNGYLSSGEILDVGCGEGAFGQLLDNKFTITNLEYPSARVKNKSVIKVDFLAWRTSKKFDAIFFLESLEHVPYPQKYLEKAESLLKKGGYIFIEYPQFDCLESKILGKYWLQLDIPRHLVHFSRKGLAILAKRNNLKVISLGGVMSYEYSPYCLLVSLMSFLKLKPLNLRKGLVYNIPTISYLIFFSPVAFLLETIFHFLNQSPVGLAIFKKQ